MVLRYSYGIKLLSRADTILLPEGNAEERTPHLEHSTIISSPPSSTTLASDIEGYDDQDPNRPFHPSFHMRIKTRLNFTIPSPTLPMTRVLLFQDMIQLRTRIRKMMAKLSFPLIHDRNTASIIRGVILLVRQPF